MKQDIVIVDLGTGNLRSVEKALDHVSGDARIRISDDPDAIRSCTHLVLPGQGAIGTWFRHLKANTDLDEAVKTRIMGGPVLGICLGLQALFARSEENGGTSGLGLLDGEVLHFEGALDSQTPEGSATLKIPHMGWNQVSQQQAHPLWHNIADDERFYFVHSYYVSSHSKDQVAGTCEYGIPFTAAAASDNLFAVQFHPEKSQYAGLTLLKNFINWNGAL